MARVIPKSETIPRGPWTARTAELIDNQIQRIIAALNDAANTATTAAAGGGGGSGAPEDAQYVLGASDGSLPNGRVLANTATVAFDLTTPGVAAANVPANSITNAKLRQGAALSVIGVAGNAIANEADIVAASASTVLGRDASNILSFRKLTSADSTGTFPAATHSLLSTTHPDTLPASPVVGDLIVATPASILDSLAFWLDGATMGALPTSADPGAGDYWAGGLPYGFLGVSTGLAVWQRLPAGTAGQVLQTTGVAAQWANAITALVGAVVARTTNLSVAAVTQTPVPLDTVAFDTSTFWSAGLPSRLTVPVGQGGRYLAVAQQTYDNGIGNFYARLTVNGVVKAAAVMSINGITAQQPMQVSVILTLVAGDYVELATFWEWSDTTARTLIGGVAATFLQLVRVGA